MLDRAAFAKRLTLVGIHTPSTGMSSLMAIVKPWLLKVPKLAPVSDLGEGQKQVLLGEEAKAEGVNLKEGEIVGNDVLVPELRTALEAKGGLKEAQKLIGIGVDIGYEQASLESVLRSILPDGVDAPSGYESVGHIAHLNLREEALPWKKEIGEVLLDKTASQIRTVVNKVGTIHHTYRFFDHEVLAGDPDLVAEVKEHGAKFRFDFSQVYWNSRLGDEHARLVKEFSQGDVVADMFAGVGPFAVPAAKAGFRVYANDLNPASYEWMVKNLELNKVPKGSAEAFNIDGREFMRKMIKEGVPFTRVVMNLPASAQEFLDVFRGVSFDRRVTVHCYVFSRAPVGEAAEADARGMCEAVLGSALKESSVFDVRDVAPNKRMYCVSFVLGGHPQSSSSGNGEKRELEGKVSGEEGDDRSVKRARQ